MVFQYAAGWASTSTESIARKTPAADGQRPLGSILESFEPGLRVHQRSYEFAQTADSHR
jgi:hypothetical protein